MSNKSTATAVWNGSLLEGVGNVTTKSPALDQAAITWKARTGGEAGTTPEELLASAHASCLCMALSGALSKAEHAVERVEAEATYTFGEADGGGFAIHGAHLVVRASVPGISAEEFSEFAEGAKSGCPVSRALTGIEITLDAELS